MIGPQNDKTKKRTLKQENKSLQKRKKCVKRYIDYWWTRGSILSEKNLAFERVVLQCMIVIILYIELMHKLGKLITRN